MKDRNELGIVRSPITGPQNDYAFFFEQFEGLFWPPSRSGTDTHPATIEPAGTLKATAPGQRGTADTPDGSTPDPEPGGVPE